jgi:hypothetical protein
MSASLSHPEAEERIETTPLEERQTRCLTNLYELRLQLEQTALEASRCGLLVAGLNLNVAKDNLAAAIHLIETKFSHLT